MSDWPDEVVQKAIALRRDGFSAAQIVQKIAPLMPGVTRSAVLGKLNRIGVKFDQPAALNRKFCADATIPRQLKPKVRRAKKEKTKTPALTGIPIALVGPIAHTPLPPPTIAFDGPPKTIVERAHGECLYAVKEDEFGTHLFCCAPVKDGFSYCSAHVAICYTPAEVRKPRKKPRADEPTKFARSAA